MKIMPHTKSHKKYGKAIKSYPKSKSLLASAEANKGKHKKFWTA